jgi:membrane fusion protein, multidrug efflux system
MRSRLYRQSYMRLLPLALIAALAGCEKPKEKAQEPVRPAMTLIVASTPNLDQVLSGTVQPQVQSPFAFRVAGRMISRPVKAGDPVAAGQLLAAIDPLSLQMAARSAVAALSSARAEYQNAVTHEARQSTLLEKKTVSQATFDSAEQARATAQANMVQAEANVLKTREQLSYAELKADYAGVVTTTSAEVGQVVQPGQAIVTIAEPTRRDAVIDATSAVAESLVIGQPFVVALQLDPAISVEGKVREIAPQADAMTRTRRVKIALDNPPSTFRLGSTIFARIAAADGNAATRLPGSALLHETPNTQVFVVDPQSLKLSLRDIEVAPDRDDHWIVRGGLKPGERVVTAGVHSLKEGQVVRIYGSAAP